MLVQHPRLVAELHEFLALHECALALYAQAIDRSDDADARTSLSEAARQLQLHLDRLETTLRDIDGNPRQEDALSRSLRARYEPFPGDLESLVMAETQISLRWRLIRTASRLIDDPHARRLLHSLAESSSDEARDRLRFAKRRQVELLVGFLTSPVSQSQAA